MFFCEVWDNLAIFFSELCFFDFFVVFDVICV